MAAGFDLHTGNWSPDGRYFTIARNTSLQYLDVTQSLVCSGHEEISLTGEPRTATAWLPDGLLLAIDPQGDLNLPPLRSCRSPVRRRWGALPGDHRG